MNCAKCGQALNTVDATSEEVACGRCKLTWRANKVLLCVLLELGYLNRSIGMIEPDMSRYGVGISDDYRVALALSSRFAYTNSYLHKFPKLDLEKPPPESIEYFEFVTCSDVLEHTPDRIRAIRGLYQILRPDGFAVITVPVTENEFTEYYPNSIDVKIESDCVVWNNKDGKTFVDRSPRFHGGDGRTLVYREYTRHQLAEDISDAGFQETDLSGHYFGAIRPGNIHMVVARKPSKKR